MAPLPNPTGAGLLRRLPVFVLPLVIALAQVQGTRFAGLNQPERTPLDALAIALLVAGPVALLTRRRYPVIVLGAVLTVTVTYYALDYPYGPAFLSVALALAGAVLRGHRRLAWVGAGSAYVTLLLVQALPGGAPAPGLAQAAGVAAWVRSSCCWPARGCGSAPSAAPRRPDPALNRTGAAPASSACRSPATCTTCSRTTSR